MKRGITFRSLSVAVNLRNCLKKLEDFADYQMVKERGGKREKTYTLEEVKRHLGMIK